MAKVSVIMPAYNCSEYISDAIASVLRQTVSDLELIVVNDGSTDKTLDIVNSIASDDPRVVILSQPNSGKPAIARNRGLKSATGEFICFLDGDDLYCEQKIQMSKELLERNPSINLVFHEAKYLDSGGNESGDTYLGRIDFVRRVLAKSRALDELSFLCDVPALFFFMCTTITTFLTSSVMIRHERLAKEEILFPEDLVAGEDIDLWFRLVKSGGVAYINCPLSCYRIHPSSVTQRYDRNLLDPVLAHIRNYDRTKGFLDAHQRRRYRKRIAKSLYYIGYTNSSQGRRSEAVRVYLRSLRWRFAIAPLKGIFKTFLLDYIPKKQANL